MSFKNADEFIKARRIRVEPLFVNTNLFELD